MQAQGDIGVLCRVGAGILHLDLIEGQLFGALAGNILEMDGLVAEILQSQAVHVVTGRCGIQHIGLEHGVVANTAQVDAVVGQHTGVILQILPDLGALRVLQQGLQHAQHLIAIQLRRRAQIIVGQWHIGGLTGLYRKGNAHHLRLHIIEAGGLGVEGKQLRCL